MELLIITLALTVVAAVFQLGETLSNRSANTAITRG